jgi:hypothetical protein
MWCVAPHSTITLHNSAEDFRLSLKEKNCLIKETFNEIVRSFAGTMTIDMENFPILIMEIPANIMQFSE